MKLTLRKYEQAKIAVKKAKAQLEIVNQWETAIAKLGNIGDQVVISIKIKDNVITTECEPKLREQKET